MVEWPWLIREMKGVAKASNIDYEDILLLNLRAWQYHSHEKNPVADACSSLAIALEDGTVACAGTLDDPVEYYCGPVKILPDDGYGFITFPITGTSWGTRGLNSMGLSIGISSQHLPGLEHPGNAISQDLAIRVILQTCADIDEVREFCKKYPFTMNLVCVDASGKIFCAHQTAAGLLESLSQGFAAMTNHISDDNFIYRLARNGVKEFPENGTSRPRRGYLLDYIKKHQGKCSMEEVCSFIGTRNDDNPGTIHNKDTIYITYSNPQYEKSTLWIKQPKNSSGPSGFEAFKI